MTCPDCASVIAGRDKAYADHDRAVAASDEILADLLRTRAAHASERESRLRAERERDEARAALAQAEARWCNEIVDHCDHPSSSWVCCSECLAAARARIEGLEAAGRTLMRLAQHEYACSGDESCTCGLDVACLAMSRALSSPSVTAEGKKLGEEGGGT